MVGVAGPIGVVAVANPVDVGLILWPTIDQKTELPLGFSRIDGVQREPAASFELNWDLNVGRLRVLVPIDQSIYWAGLMSKNVVAKHNIR